MKIKFIAGFLTIAIIMVALFPSGVSAQTASSAQAQISALLKQIADLQAKITTIQSRTPTRTPTRVSFTPVVSRVSGELSSDVPNYAFGSNLGKITSAHLVPVNGGSRASLEFINKSETYALLYLPNTPPLPSGQYYLYITNESGTSAPFKVNVVQSQQSFNLFADPEVVRSGQGTVFFISSPQPFSMYTLKLRCPQGVAAKSSSIAGLMCNDGMNVEIGYGTTHVEIPVSFANSTTESQEVILTVNLFNQAGNYLGEKSISIKIAASSTLPTVGATITSPTLTTSQNPTIYGTASGVSQVGISMGDAGGKAYGSGPLPVVNGKWSVTVSPALAYGNYTIDVFDTSSNKLTSGTLTISPAQQPLTLSVVTDKYQYSSSETIKIYYKLYNGGSSPVTLNFNSGCQTAYSIAYYDSTSNQACPAVIGQVVINPGTAHYWEVSHSPAQYKIPAGSYKLEGRILASNYVLSSIAPNPITITDSTQTGAMKVTVTDGTIVCVTSPCGVLTNATVSVYAANTGVSYGTKSTSAGAAVFENLPVGTYGAVVNAPGYQSDKEGFSVVAGQGGYLNVKLQPLTTTQPSITVVSPNGGETWSTNSKYTVSYTQSGLAGIQAKVHLVKQGQENGTACLLKYVTLGQNVESPTASSLESTIVDLSQGCLNPSEFGTITSGFYKIQIYAGNGLGTQDTSDNYLTVTSSVPTRTPTRTVSPYVSQAEAISQIAATLQSIQLLLNSFSR